MPDRSVHRMHSSENKLWHIREGDHMNINRKSNTNFHGLRNFLWTVVGYLFGYFIASSLFLDSIDQVGSLFSGLREIIWTEFIRFVLMFSLIIGTSWIAAQTAERMLAYRKTAGSWSRIIACGLSALASTVIWYHIWAINLDV